MTTHEFISTFKDIQNHFKINQESFYGMAYKEIFELAQESSFDCSSVLSKVNPSAVYSQESNNHEN